MDSLPLELVEHVASFIEDFSTLRALSCVCRRFQYLAWSAVTLEEEYPTLSSQATASVGEDGADSSSKSVCVSSSRLQVALAHSPAMVTISARLPASQYQVDQDGNAEPRLISLLPLPAQMVNSRLHTLNLWGGRILLSPSLFAQIFSCPSLAVAHFHEIVLSDIAADAPVELSTLFSQPMLTLADVPAFSHISPALRELCLCRLTGPAAPAMCAALLLELSSSPSVLDRLSITATDIHRFRQVPLALSALLSRSSAIRVLSLSCALLSDDDLVEIARGLAQNKSLVRLSLDGNPFGLEGRRALLHAVSCHPLVRELRMLDVSLLDWDGSSNMPVVTTLALPVAPMAAVAGSHNPVDAQPAGDAGDDNIGEAATLVAVQEPDINHISLAIPVVSVAARMPLQFDETATHSDWPIPEIEAIDRLSSRSSLLGVPFGSSFHPYLGRAQSLTSIDLGFTTWGATTLADFARALSSCVSLEQLLVVHTNMGDYGALLLAGPLASIPGLRSFDFSCNHIGNTGLAAIARALHRRAQAQLCAPLDVILSGNEFTAYGAAILGAAIAGGAGSFLHLLDLSMNHLAVPNGAITSLLAGLTHAPGLHALYLCNCEIDDAVISYMSAHAAAWPALRHVLLCSNNITDRGVACLAHALAPAIASIVSAVQDVTLADSAFPAPERPTSLSLQTLHLDDNLISDRGAFFLALALNSSVRSAEHSPCVATECIPARGGPSAACSDHGHGHSFGHGEHGSSDAVNKASGEHEGDGAMMDGPAHSHSAASPAACLATGVSHCCASLHVLSLSGNRISAQGAKELVATLQRGPLTQLDLRDNTLSSADVAALAAPPRPGRLLLL